MGCDIHIYAEVKKDGKWIPAVEFRPSSWWFESISERDETNTDLDWKEVKSKYDMISIDEAVKQYGDDPEFLWENTFDAEFGQRNYIFFGIIAGVRSYDTKSMVSEPRGLPKDVSPQVKRHSDQWGVDGHSHSYLTLKELQDFDWYQMYQLENTMTARVYANTVLKFKGLTTIKRSYANLYIIDKNETRIPQHDLEKMCYGIYGLYDPTYDYIADVEWEETYRDMVGPKYLDDLFNRLESFADDPNDVRVVFWFDN